MEVGANREPDCVNSMRWIRFTLLLIPTPNRTIGMRTAANKMRAPGPCSYVHQPAGQLNAANCAAQQHAAYVMFDGPIETGFLGG